MPTTTRTHTPEDQERERHRLQSLPVPLTVWECGTPAGGFRLRKLGTQYALDGNGRAMTLFGQTDYMDPDIGITAVNDADAISQTKTLIFARWAEERDRMRAAFWPEPAADGEAWRVAEAGPLPDVDSDDDLTADLDEPRADTPAEAAALG